MRAASIGAAFALREEGSAVARGRKVMARSEVDTVTEDVMARSEVDTGEEGAS